MEISMFQSFFCALLGSFALAVLLKPQDQSGFICIDCEVLSSSNDESSDIMYVLDVNFVETGTSKSISSEFQTTTHAKQFCVVRSFHESRKNCYTFLPTQVKDSLGTHGKIKERIAFLKVVPSEKQSTYQGYISDLTLVELRERLKNGSVSLRMDIDASLRENPSLFPATSSQQKDKNLVIPLTVTLFVLSIAFTIFLRHKTRKEQALVENKDISLLKLKNRHFKYSEVLQITNNFKKVLGEDGFGTVYHGYLNDTQVAVKMLSLSSCQGYAEFQTEVKVLTRIHHPNLIKLIGYCYEDTNVGLIYEYIAKGNVQKYLSDRNATTLSWENRLRMALDAAQGLEYLHKGCTPPIVHGDVKSTNVLLNENLEAKLTGFGLSRIFSMKCHTHESKLVCTPDYLDPEYYVTNQLNQKTDVYSFGLVLMEIITGQPVILKNENQNTHISQWIMGRVETGDMENIADPSLEGEYGASSAWKVVELALACAYHVSSKRPTMDEVVIELKECLAMELAWKKEPSQWSWQ